MVGYGAGAWQVAQLEKYGYGFPQVQERFDHCDTRPTDEETPDSVDGGMTPVFDDAGVQVQADASNSNGASPTPNPIISQRGTCEGRTLRRIHLRSVAICSSN